MNEAAKSRIAEQLAAYVQRRDKAEAEVRRAIALRKHFESNAKNFLQGQFTRLLTEVQNLLSEAEIKSAVGRCAHLGISESLSSDDPELGVALQIHLNASGPHANAGTHSKDGSPRPFPYFALLAEEGREQYRLVMILDAATPAGGRNKYESIPFATLTVDELERKLSNWVSSVLADAT